MSTVKLTFPDGTVVECLAESVAAVVSAFQSAAAAPAKRIPAEDPLPAKPPPPARARNVGLELLAEVSETKADPVDPFVCSCPCKACHSGTAKKRRLFFDKTKVVCNACGIAAKRGREGEFGNKYNGRANNACWKLQRTAYLATL